ncbi:MAG: universal stress protein [Thermomicrobiales bacterium]
MTSILACVDGARYTSSVCEYTAWAAKRMNASVRLLYVNDFHAAEGMDFDLSGSLGASEQETLLAEFTALDEQRGRLAQKRGRLILDEARNRLTSAGVANVLTRQRHGVFVDTVIELEEIADLVVLGKRGESAKSTISPHLGGNLERVVRASQKPVLVASRMFQPISRFMIAFDGGPSINQGIEYISQMPLLKGIDCCLLMVGADNDGNLRRVSAAAQTLIRAGFNVETRIKSGNPDDVIPSEVAANNIDLIVMGAFGHSRIRTLIIGSTTTATLRNCRIPVLMFRA